MQEQLEAPLAAAPEKRRSRLLVKKGRETIAIRFDDIAAFYCENKIVYVLCRSGQKLVCDKTLAELESWLDSSLFFRANRQVIVHLDAIVSFRPTERVKLALKLMVDHVEPVIISQQTAPHFKKWIYEA